MRAHTIHHVSAITADRMRNLDFYSRVLGLRLVKRTVNQDDVRVYHLFYADKQGSPGTDFTFFDLPTSAASTPGPGTIASTYLRVPGASLDWWEDRLSQAGAHPHRGVDHEEREGIALADPEGQRLLLVDDTGIPGSSVPWDEEVPKEYAIRGILGVDIESARPAATSHVLTEILNFQATNRSGGLFYAGDDSSFASIRLVESNALRPGRVGAGGVHHVAFRVADDEELREMQRRVEDAGIKTTGFVDRFYFHSLYFREPGGILFELATDGPGFSADEPMEELGQGLSLPPFLEPRREEIEAGLAPWDDPNDPRS